MLIGMLLALILIVGLTAFFQTSHINNKVNEIAEVEHRTSETAYQMKINLMETGVSVLKYLQDNSPAHLAEIKEGEKKFQEAQRTYTGLEQTEKIAALGKKVENTHQQFIRSVDSLIKLQDHQSNLLAQWDNKYEQLNKILENETYIPEKRFDAHKDLKMRASLKVQAMKVNANQLKNDLGKYLKTRDGSFETAIQTDEKELLKNFNLQQAVARPERKERFAFEIRSITKKLYSLTDSIVQAEKVKQATLLYFEKGQKEFSQLLEEQVLILANKNLIKAKDEAIEAGNNSNLIISVILIVTLLFGSITGFLFTRNITRPLKLLVDATRSIAENDFTKRVEVNSKDELEALANAFNQMTLQLQIAQQKQAELVLEIERSNLELADFAHVVSHDLKAPLRGIHTVSEWLEKGFSDKLDNTGVEQLNLIRKKVKHMSDMIDGILKYSKISKQNGQKERVDITILLKEVMESLNTPGHIKIEIQNNFPTVNFERIRLQQVFQNLISNAIKYMDKQQGTVMIRYENADKFWKFCIFDNGPGIEERFLKNIFKLFQTIKPKDERESTGVGLAIVQKIVETAGGSVWVKSKVGEGSVFYFTILKDHN